MPEGEPGRLPVRPSEQICVRRRTDPFCQVIALARQYLAARLEVIRARVAIREGLVPVICEIATSHTSSVSISLAMR